MSRTHASTRCAKGHHAGPFLEAYLEGLGSKAEEALSANLGASSESTSLEEPLASKPSAIALSRGQATRFLRSSCGPHC
jgi:hypothetical protein